MKHPTELSCRPIAVAIAIAIGVGLGSACAMLPAQEAPEPAAVSAPSPPAITRPEPPEPGRLPSAPLPRTDAAVLSDFKLEVTDFVRGEAAWQALHAASAINTPAASNWEYALVRVRFTGSAASTWVGCEDLRVIGTERIAYFHGPQQPPAPTLPDAPLEAGRTADGWCVYPVHTADRSLLLMIGVQSPGRAPELRYVALERDAALPRIERAEATHDRIGETVRTAAAPGSAVTTPDWSVTVLRTLRGEPARQLIANANHANPAPANGLEFLAVELHAVYHGDAEQPRLLSAQQFEVIGGDGKPYERPVVLDVDPSLACTLLPGGEHTGWAVFQIAPSDDRAVLRFEPYYPERAMRYLALHEAEPHAAPEARLDRVERPGSVQ